jgi:hypothetical protein
MGYYYLARKENDARYRWWTSRRSILLFYRALYLFCQLDAAVQYRHSVVLEGEDDVVFAFMLCSINRIP